MNIPDNIKLEDLPPEIINLALHSISKIPIGISYYEDLIKRFPEYFKDEIEWEQNYKKVPQEVHDNYRKDMDEKNNYVSPLRNNNNNNNISDNINLSNNTNLPNRNNKQKKYGVNDKETFDGIMCYVNSITIMESEIEESNKLFGTYTEIWNKHYSKFGLKR